MTPEAILECWESVHQPLSPAQTIAFLSRPEIDELTGLPDDAVRTAIEQDPKLADVLALALVLAATTTLVDGASWWFDGTPCEDDHLVYCSGASRTRTPTPSW